MLAVLILTVPALAWRIWVLAKRLAPLSWEVMLLIFLVAYQGISYVGGLVAGAFDLGPSRWLWGTIILLAGGVTVALNTLVTRRYEAWRQGQIAKQRALADKAREAAEQ